MGLIVNPRAPVDIITITVDNRTNPPDIQFAASRQLPAPMVQKIMAFCISGLADMMMGQPAAVPIDPTAAIIPKVD